MSILTRLKGFAEASRRVLILAKKPNAKEYGAMSKVTAIGIVIIALIGFFIALFFTFTAIGI